MNARTRFRLACALCLALFAPAWVAVAKTSARPYSAIRLCDRKLIEFFEGDLVELYNLRDDLGEKNDLVSKFPGKTSTLREKLHEIGRASCRERVCLAV